MTERNLTDAALSMATALESDIDVLLRRIRLDLCALGDATEWLEGDLEEHTEDSAITAAAVSARVLRERFEDLAAKLEQRARLQELLQR